MKNGGSNQVVLKLIKLRKKRKQMRLLNKLCYYKPNKEVIKNREKKKLFFIDIQIYCKKKEKQMRLLN